MGCVQFDESILEAIRIQPFSLDGPYTDFVSAVTSAFDRWAADTNEAEVCFYLNEEAVIAEFVRLRPMMIGLLEQQRHLLNAASVAERLKLRELLEGLVTSLNKGWNRICVLCCRTLMEEAAQFKANVDQVEKAVEAMRITPPSSFREERLRRLYFESKEKHWALAKGLFDVRIAILTWYHARRVRMNAFYDFDDVELKKTDWLHPRSVLTAIDKWQVQTARQGERSAREFYDRLCEVTHPNSASTGLYFTNTRESKAKIWHTVKVEPDKIARACKVLDFICRPTVAAIELAAKQFERIEVIAAAISDYHSRINAAP